jgi:methionyl-tRNA formyltransferase
MLGTGEFALPTFEHLLGTGHNVIALITQPDRPQGRKRELIPSRIKLSAQAHNVPVIQPENVNSAEGIEAIRKLTPELMVTAAYGQILSAELLSIPDLGGINLHGSILPAYRGAAPVARAIQNGEVETGVTIIRMTSRIDAGGMIAIARTPIGPDETSGELEERLAQLGAPLVVESVAKLIAGSATILPQDRAKVTKAPKLSKDDGIIDWSKSAKAIHDLVRAMQPWPIASTLWHSQKGAQKAPIRLIVHETTVVAGQGSGGEVLEAQGDRLIVAAGEGAVAVKTIQIAGKKPLTAAEFLRGHRVEVGDRMETAD